MAGAKGRAVIRVKLAWLMLLSCGVAIAQGDGATCDNAVVVAGVEAEYQWLRKTYGGGSMVRQVLAASPDGKRRYDLVRWRKPDGATVDVCFDVTKAFENDPGRPPR